MSLFELFLLIIFVVSVFVFLRQILSRFLVKHQLKGMDQTSKQKLLNAFLSLAIPFILYLVLTWLLVDYPEYKVLILYLMKAIIVFGLILFYRFINFILKLINQRYNLWSIAKTRPIEPLLQALRLFIIVVLVIIAISAIIGQDIIVLVGSIGAFTAVLSLIFKDLILGFFASLLLTGNDIIQIGDFIEVKSMESEGTVESVNLTTVTLANKDNSKTTLPSYKLLSSEIINYRYIAPAANRYFSKTLILKYKTDSDELRLQQFLDEIREVLEEFPKVVNDKPIIIRLNQQQLAGHELQVSFYIAETNLQLAHDYANQVMTQLVQIQNQYHFI